MTRPDARHARLIEAASLAREMRLFHVAAARTALAASLAQRDALDPPPTDSDDPAMQAADLRHRLWAEGRRRALGPVIAAQEAALLQRRTEAARAVARCQVLDHLFRKRRDQPS
jgi:hypothetical protein